MVSAAAAMRTKKRPLTKDSPAPGLVAALSGGLRRRQLLVGVAALQPAIADPDLIDFRDARARRPVLGIRIQVEALGHLLDERRRHARPHVPAALAALPNEAAGRGNLLVFVAEREQADQIHRFSLASRATSGLASARSGA